MKIAMYVHHAGVGGAEDMFRDQVACGPKDVEYIFVTESASGESATLEELRSMGVQVFRTDGSVGSFRQVYADQGVNLVHGMACGDIQAGFRAAIDLGLPIVETAACVAYSGIWESGYRNLNVVYLCQSHWVSGGGGHDFFKKIDGGVDLQRCLVGSQDKRQCKSHWGLDPNRPVVGWYNRFDQFKCPFSFIDIATIIHQEFPACQFIMFGGGVDLGRSQYLSTTANLPIKFTGFTREKGLAFGAMDVYAFPSWQEAFGRVMVESMACGIPIVTSEYPVMHELCGDAAIYIENARQDPMPMSVSRKYAESSLSLLEDDEKRKLMGGIGIERSKHYDAARMAEEYITLYKSMVH